MANKNFLSYPTLTKNANNFLSYPNLAKIISLVGVGVAGVLGSFLFFKADAKVFIAHPFLESICTRQPAAGDIIICHKVACGNCMQRLKYGLVKEFGYLLFGYLCMVMRGYIHG